MITVLKKGFFFLLLSVSATAQIYPVQVTPILLPPYTLNTSDYYSGTVEKLAVVLTNTDLQSSPLAVRLRMSIEGQNATLQNREGYYPPIHLDAGLPTRVSLGDLAPYFQVDNLNFQGITRSQYSQNSKLPEGFYKFCFEAIDINTGKVLSRKSCTMAWISLSDPPILNLPTKGESVPALEVQNIIFQWTPRNMGSANGAFNTEYEFTLKELWDTGLPAEAGFENSPVFHQSTVSTTTLLVGPSDPPLIVGKRYAWRVRAISKTPTGEQADSYRNNGYSEFFWFTYQDKCKPPTGTNATLTRGRPILKWMADATHTEGYIVQYKEKSQSSGDWYSITTKSTQATLYDLKGGRTYEYRVGAACPTQSGTYVYSEIKSFVMEDVPPQDCGTIVAASEITNKTPALKLYIGDVFTAGKFPVTIIKIRGARTFTGEGYVTIPWLAQVQVKVRFTNISINTDKELFAGVVETIYNKKKAQVGDLDDLLEGGNNVGKVKTGNITIDKELDYTLPSKPNFELNKTGDITVTDDQGTPHVITPKTTTDKKGQTTQVFPMTVKDKSGKIYQLDKETEKLSNGKTKEKIKVKEIGKQSEPLAKGSYDTTKISSDWGTVTFEKGKGEYAFDTWQPYYEKVLLIKEKYNFIGKYEVPWKFLAENQSDVVEAKIEIKNKNLKAEKVIFKTPKGTEYKATYSNGAYTLQLTAGPAGDAQEIYALYPHEKEGGKYYTLGKLNVATYKAQQYKVKIVTINNAAVDIAQVQQALDKIYKPVGVSWEATQEEMIYSGETNLFDKGTGLSTYNENMRALNRAYGETHTIEADVNYLFILPPNNERKSNDRIAFMPRGGQYGYLYTSDGSIMAHELGHGRWKMRHTFDSQYGGFEKGSTNNLMDYGDQAHIQAHLAKWQWDIINDPASIVNVFERDEKGARIDPEFITKFINNLRKSFQQETDITLENNVIPGQDDNNITGEFRLVENNTRYPKIKIIRYWGYMKKITFQVKYYKLIKESKRIEIYNEKKETLLAIEFINPAFVNDAYFQSLSQHIFWKPEKGKNMTLFVNGFDVLIHKELLGCTSGTLGVEIGTAVATRLSLWLVYSTVKTAYVMTNSKPFIQDLKEVIIPIKCQEEDLYTNYHTISTTDINDYWGEIDDLFTYRIGSGVVVYANGDNSIRTATDNAGFARRVNDGRQGGTDLLTKIKNKSIVFENDSKIDVVVHSMGYAYALGMIEELQKAGIKIGWIYAIAPENPGQGWVPKDIEGIWQYGSQETDPKYKQDGIAPQVAIPGIDRNQRVPIDESAPQNFYASHVLENYGWIFTRNKDENKDEDKKERGHVKSRKGNE